MMNDLTHKKVLVLGLGDTGLSMARWLIGQGADVRIADTRQAPPKLQELHKEFPKIKCTTGAYQKENFEGIDLIAASPGVPIKQPFIAQAQAKGIEVVGDVELFARSIGARSKVIAITGSNGKTTVTSMVGEMCKAAGLNTVVAGNIGWPVLDALTEVNEQGRNVDIYVLELSSFQLETTYSLKSTAATVLNISEDHLDRYDSMTDYAMAKARIYLTAEVQVINRQDEWSKKMLQSNKPIVSFGSDAPANDQQWGLQNIANDIWLMHGKNKLMSLAKLPLAGLHNAANALAALALCSPLNLSEQSLISALQRFRGLPHRVQKVGEIKGVEFYDDSKGTNVGATVAALNGIGQASTIQRKVVLIAGGDGKGQDFSPLKAVIAKYGRAVVLIGRDGEKIAEAIDSNGVPISRAKSMEEAVDLSFEQARSGDVVLMSPACASFDMFRNYEHRAEVFVQAVNKLVSRYTHA